MVESDTRRKMNSELGERLLGHDQNLQVSPDQLSDLFDQDKVKDLQQGQTVSVSLYTLQKRLGGVEGLVKSLQSDSKLGISDNPDELESRVKQFGSNRLKERRMKTIIEMIGEAFEDTILQILIAAALISTVVGVIKDGWMGLVEGGSILLAVVIIVGITTANNYKKEKQFQELQRKSDLSTTIVIRSGQTKTVSAEDLVVGDIVTIEAGKTIPADCVLINSLDLQCNEAGLTGESENLHKSHVTQENYSSNPVPFILESTLAETGQAKAIVCAVGERTQAGKADRILDIESELTPLQSKLETIANQIGKVGLYSAILTFMVLMIRLMKSIFIQNKVALMDFKNVTAVLNAFIIAVTVIVVAVPEGLPLAVTISLAFSVSKMYKENNLVRSLHAAETMGGANEICTDKTGTLTQNRMSVQALYMANEQQFGDSYPSLPINKNCEILSETVLFNCSAFVENEKTGLKVVKGNVTEIGLIKFLMSSRVDVESVLEQKKSEQFIEMQIPFSSKRKRQTTAVRHKNGKIRVFVKGAPEIVIEHCSRILDKNGQTSELTKEARNDIINVSVVKQFASKCYRTLLVAYVDYELNEWESLKSSSKNFETEADRETVEKNLILVGIFGLMDPLRPGIKEALLQCKRSGINVRMVTGDNIDTAIAISKEAGIITDTDLLHNEQGYLCMTGKNFREMVGGLTTIHDSLTNTRTDSVGNKRAFRDIAKKLKVLARSSPEDKYLLVTGLRDEGNVVAVTGDGTNDAPALNKADVGFSMGVTGTDVAKNASDIVLTDDNFCSVLTAVKYGRNIFDSVRKFLQFQLTVNIVALFIVFAGAIIFEDPPLTSVQMLWVNLIMDTFAALALATEAPSIALLDRQPQSRFDKIVDATMWRNILGQGVFQIVVLLVMLLHGQRFFELPFTSTTPFYVNQTYLDANPGQGLALWDPTNKVYLYTMVFQTFVFMTLFNSINSRKLGAHSYNVLVGFFDNNLFLMICFIIFFGQVALVQYGGMATRTVPLTMNENLLCFGIGALSLVWGLIVKLILPVSLFQRLAINEKQMTDAEEKETFNAVLRRSFRQSTLSRSQRSIGHEHEHQNTSKISLVRTNIQ